MGGTRVLLWLAIVVVCFVFLYLVRSILLPFVVAIFAAALLDPLIRNLRKRGFSKAGAVWIVFIIFIGTVTLIGAWAAPRIVNQVVSIQDTVKDYINNTLFPPTKIDRFLGRSTVRERLVLFKVEPPTRNNFQEWLESPKTDVERINLFLTLSEDDLREEGIPKNREAIIEEIINPSEKGTVDKMIEDNAETLGRMGLPTDREGFEELLQIEQRVKDSIETALGGASGVVSYLLSSAILLFFIPIITLFFLMEYDLFKRRFITWIPPTLRKGTLDLLSDISAMLASYLRGLTASVTIYIVVTAIIFSVLGVPFGLFLAVVVGIFYLIPMVGWVLSVGTIWLAIVAKSTMGPIFYQFPTQTSYIIIVMIVYLAYHFTHDQLIHPQVVGRKVGLNPVVSYFVVFSGYALFGLAGMILAFPIAGTIKVILDRLIRYTTTGDEELDLPRIPKRHTA